MNAAQVPVLYPAIIDDRPAPGTQAAPNAPDPTGFATALGAAFDGASASLERAAQSESAFASGRGGLQAMVLARAQADVALQIATVAASRTSQALSSILAMQI